MAKRRHESKVISTRLKGEDVARLRDLAAASRENIATVLRDLLLPAIRGRLELLNPDRSK